MLLIACVQVNHARGMATGDEIRPDYGTKFSQVGKVIQGLNRYDLVIGIELPERYNNLGKVGNLLPTSFNEFCDRINNNSLAYEVCIEMIPVMEEYKYHEGEYLKRIMKRLEYDLVAILPDLDKRNDIDKATKVRKLGDYHFPIKNQKLYEWEYKNRMKVPKPPNEEKLGIKEHVEEAVDEELGEVYHLIRSLKRQIQTDELQRQARARSVDQARREEQRARDVRGETFRNSQFNGRRKRNVSDDIVEQLYPLQSPQPQQRLLLW